MVFCTFVKTQMREGMKMARSKALDSDFSLHRQVETILRDQIADGVLRPGDRLPSEEELRQQYGVSRGTLRQALEALERDGWLDRSRGRGTFVKAGAAGDAEQRRHLSADAMIAQAVRATRLMRAGSAVPLAIVSDALGIDARVEVPFFIRLSEPAAEGRIGVKRYLAPALAPRLEELAGTDDFAAALTASGRAPGRIDRGATWVEAILAEPRFAMQLKVPLGSPLLSLWWVDRVDGRPVACTQMLRAGASAALRFDDGRFDDGDD